MAGAPQGYIGRNPADGRTTINRQRFTVTDGTQTSFTFTTGYDLGYLDVYLNGVRQVESLDYSADDGSTFSFAVSTPAVQGDVVEAVAYKSFNTTNVTGSTRDFSVGRNLDVTGNVTIGSSLTIASDLVVNGTYTYVNTEVLEIEDKTVGIASTSAASNTTADGAGIVVYGGAGGDKSLLWDKDLSNWVLSGGGISLGTGVTISTPATNVLAFSIDGAVNAKLNNYGAFIVGDGVTGEAWDNAYKAVQVGSGGFIGQVPGASASSYWTNNAYFDSVNSRWEYIAADEATKLESTDGVLTWDTAGAGSADGAITWTNRFQITSSAVSASTMFKSDSFESNSDLVLNSDSNANNSTNDSIIFKNAGTERVRIKGTGYTGIGTDNPQEKLHLYGGNCAIEVDAPANRYCSVGFSVDGASKWWMGRGDSDVLSETSFFIGKDAGNATDKGGNSAKFVIDSAGNVNVTGILTATSFSGPISGTTGTFTGDVSIADKIVHIGDTNTAIRFPAADTITAETGGSERVRVTSTGKVGIGSDNPDVKLTVCASSGDSYIRTIGGTNQGLLISNSAGTLIGGFASGGALGGGVSDVGLRVESGNNILFSHGTTEKARINSSGELLIDHNASVGSGKLQVFTKDDDAIDILSFASANSEGGRLTFYRNKNTTYGSNTKLAINDQLGRIDFRGMNTEGTDNYEIGASIQAFVDGTPGSGSDASDMPGRLTFFTTADSSDSPTEKVRIDSSGRLHVGSSNNTGANTKLVVGAGNNINSTALINTGDVDVDALTLSNWDGSTATSKVMIALDSSGVGGFNIGMPAATDALVIEDDGGIECVRVEPTKTVIRTPITLSSAAAVQTGTDTRGGLAFQRYYEMNVDDGELRQLGWWSEGEGAVALAIEVTTDTGGNSGTSYYMWQGGFGQLSGDYYRLLPLHVGRGHGVGPDPGTDTDSWSLYVSGQGVHGSSYQYGLAIANSGSVATQYFKITVNEISRGMTYTDKQDIAAVSSWTITSSIYSSERSFLSRLNVNTGGSGFNGMLSSYAASGQPYPIAAVCANTNQGAIGIYYSTTTVGSITISGGNSTAFNTSSDYRLKENVVDITDGITRLKQLKPRRFNWISDSTNTLQDGFLAHEVAPSVPIAIVGTKDKVADATDVANHDAEAVGDPIYQQMDYSKLVPLLTAALQEAITEIETLKTKVAALESA